MRIELEQKKIIDELKKKLEEAIKDMEYWKQKAYDMYEEYQLLCDKIIQQGIFFKRKDDDTNATDG